MENISDQTGRAFEFAIVSELTRLSGVTLTSRASDAQIRDSAKFEALDSSRKRLFQEAAKALVKMLVENGVNSASVDRLSDDEAAAGDVTDIRITPIGKHPVINLSIKNNHHALKHQRPPSLMQQLGFGKGSSQDCGYRAQLQSVFDSFCVASKRLVPDAKKFSQLKDVDHEFINRQLYAPVCELVTATLRKHLANSIVCQTYFRFLVGNTDYIKVVLSQGQLEITHFDQIPMPSTCTVDYSSANPGYIYLTFDNGWKISMRLHTASSRLAEQGQTPSTKFDTQPMLMPLQSTYIQL